MIDLSIVIPCYLKNEELLNLTKSAIYSFHEAVLPENTEIVIVDDGSPMYGGYLRECSDVCVTHAKNKGFIKSVNDGIKMARGDFVVVANNDIRVAPNFFDASLDIFEMFSDVISVHPRMLFYEDKMELGGNTYTEGKERWCQSSFFIIKRIGNDIPLFPEFYAGTGGAYEDWAYWSRIRRFGFKTAYTTTTCFQHKDSSTTQVVGEENKHHAINRELFKNEFGDYPEEYYNKLYPDQMSKPWREEFFKL